MEDSSVLSAVPAAAAMVAGLIKAKAKAKQSEAKRSEREAVECQRSGLISKHYQLTKKQVGVAFDCLPPLPANQPKRPGAGR